MKNRGEEMDEEAVPEEEMQSPVINNEAAYRCVCMEYDVFNLCVNTSGSFLELQEEK
jgi:hypothetical protein